MLNHDHETQNPQSITTKCISTRFTPYKNTTELEASKAHVSVAQSYAHLVHLCPAVLVTAAQCGAVPEQQEAAGQLSPLQHTVVQRGE